MGAGLERRLYSSSVCDKKRAAAAAVYGLWRSISVMCLNVCSPCRLVESIRCIETAKSILERDCFYSGSETTACRSDSISRLYIRNSTLRLTIHYQSCTPKTIQLRYSVFHSLVYFRQATNRPMQNSHKDTA